MFLIDENLMLEMGCDGWILECQNETDKPIYIFAENLECPKVNLYCFSVCAILPEPVCHEDC